MPGSPREAGPAAPSCRGRRLLLVVAVAAVVAGGLAWLTPYNDYYIGATYVATHHVPLVASVLLALLAGLLSPALGRLYPPLRLSRPELVAFWLTLTVPSGIPSSALMRFLIPVLPALRYYATPENRFAELLWPHYPGWLVPTDETAIAAFYDGATGPMLPYWRAWLLPALAWSLIALLAWWVMFVLASLLRRQWCDHERMSFPHVQLPLEIVGGPAGPRAFFRSRLMWIGFALPAILYALTGLHEFFPAVPKPRFLWPGYYAHALSFRSRPWSAVPAILPAVFPSIIAFGYLVTAEVSFSIWAGYLLLVAETVVLAAFGLGMRTVTSGMGGLQFAGFQDMGAYLALAVVIAHVSRRHLASLWADAWAGAAHDGRSRALRREALPSRALFLTGALALLALVWILSSAGLSLPLALAFLLAYFLVCVVLAWATSNTGLLLVGCSFRPEDYVYYLAGTRGLAQRSLAAMALPSRVLTFYYREYLMPHFLNGYRLADDAGLDRRAAAASMWTGVLLVLPVAWAAHLWLAYARGANALQALTYRSWAPMPFRAALSYILSPGGPDPQAYVFGLLGAAATAAVIALRARVSWWPFHPVGLILASAASREIWLSMLIAWVCKVGLLRYGGAASHRAGRTFFMGVALGEAAIATAWIVVGMVTHTGVRLLP